MVDLDLLRLQATDGIVIEDDHVVSRLIGMVPELLRALGRVAHHDQEVLARYRAMQDELKHL